MRHPDRPALVTIEQAVAGSMERTALIVVGHVLGAQDFAKSSLNAPGYDRRFRLQDSLSRFMEASE